MMSSKHIQQCCNCHRWITKGKSAYMKHIQHCQPKLTGSSVLDHDGIRSKKSLLSLFTDTQSPNINYNCNLYDDQYADDDYASSVNYDSYISHNNDIIDTDDIKDNNFQEPFMSLNKPFSQQTNASNWFQIMLHDLVMKHRASLQIFNEICNLVNEYTASPDFSEITKLPSRKSFLRSIKETYCTHGLRPTNRIVRLHDNSYVTVLVFDTKEMIIF
jgi:hypothetical protein